MAPDQNHVTPRLRGYCHRFQPFLELPFLLLLFVVGGLLLGVLLTTHFVDIRVAFNNSAPKSSTKISDTFVCEKPGNTCKPVETQLNCTAYGLDHTCPVSDSTSFQPDKDDFNSSSSMCPEYFRWIYEDLHPWRRTGITRDMVETARQTAHFKLVILKGKAYVEKYRRSFQTRDIFTLWGIIQLLNKYPEKIPDLELMFDCGDLPVIFSNKYSEPRTPPPLFRYCGSADTLDIVFPDWSFWGWPEINIKPWIRYFDDLEEANKRMEWINREPYAYWKGNPKVHKRRRHLLKCNVSDNQDWNARLFDMNWIMESKQGFKQSDITSQCTHRYKIYVEGSGWSVSDKYILACDSVALFVSPHYYDFFSRGLMPLHHYWPIREDDTCRSIKFAVDWGNNHTEKAQSIGKAGSDFIRQDLKMEFVYDYMFHLFNEYAKLLTFEPNVNEHAIELCAESLVCRSHGMVKEFFTETMAEGPEKSNPCTMRTAHNPSSHHDIITKKENSIKQVELWEKIYWNNESTKNIYIVIGPTNFIFILILQLFYYFL